MSTKLSLDECDSDLEGKEEEVTIHDESNIPKDAIKKSSKKRSFHEMEKDDNHYTSKHSKNKLQKLEHPSNSPLLDSFLHDSDNDSDEDDAEQDSDAQDEDITVDQSSSLIQNVEFEMKDIYEEYYHEVRDIIASTDWDQKKLNVGQLTDIIIKQEEIGGVLTCSNSVLGFITLLSFNKYFEHLSLAHIRRFLSNRCKQSGSKKKKFENYFNHKKHNIGLLLHERPINVPLEAIPFIYESLYKDIQYATNKNEAKHLSEEECELFKCDYILMVVRYRWFPKQTNDGKEEEDDDLQQNGNNDNSEILLPQLTNKRNKMKLVYEHLEDDLFVKKADFQFDFERNDKVWNVLLVKTSHLKDIIQEMHQIFSV